MDIVIQIFTTLVAVFEQIGTLFTSGITSVVSLIYTPGVGDAAGSLTVFGVLCLIGTAMGLFKWIFSWIRGLIKVKA